MMVYATAMNVYLLLRRGLRDKDAPPVAALNSAGHLITLPALLLLPIALLRRDFVMFWRLLPSALSFGKNYGAMAARRALGSEAPQRAEPMSRQTAVPTFSLLTFNVHGENDPVHVETLLHVIREVGADVVNLQESSPALVDAAAKALAHIYPHRAAHTDALYASAGMSVFSKFAITADEYWRYPDTPNALGWQRVTLELPSGQTSGTSIALYNCHPVHPLMVGRFFDAAPRTKEIEALLERTAGEALPTLLAGDFNLTDQSDEYRLLSARFKDAFNQVGRGMGYTFPDLSAPQARSLMIGKLLPFLRPLMRLDYVFYDQHFYALDAQVWPRAGGSDHRPLLVRLVVLHNLL
jgi:endonuclease/exonuclease/phosphatase family metal-dependent hydrolase